MTRFNLTKHSTFLVAMLLFIVFTSMHPFFVGITEYNLDTRTSKQEVFELKVKLFTDDLEASFQKETGARLPEDFYHIKEDSEVGKAIYPLLENYFNKNIQLAWYITHFSNEKMVYLPLKIQKMEPKEEYTQITFEINLPKKKWLPIARRSKAIFIKNQLLMSYKKEQKHIVHCNWNGIRKSDYVDSKNPQFIWRK